MVVRLDPQDAAWSAVDDYIGVKLLGEDAVLEDVLAANRAAGLPDIDVSPSQGRMLTLLARMAGAQRILEVGSLGGYSTICLARALPADGSLVSLEIDPHHADVARANVTRAGLADRVEVLTGAALDLLPRLPGPFDFVFIDADKQSNMAYVEHALRLSRPGTTIVVDNVVREGRVVEAHSDSPQVRGTRALFDFVSAHPQFTATAVQTVGVKKWDGFMLAIVNG